MPSEDAQGDNDKVAEKAVQNIQKAAFEALLGLE